MNKKTKILFVVGGVFSGIGKGILAASLGNNFKENGAKVGIIKLDPYLNVTAAHIEPEEHGEASITPDGYLFDLDVGTYSRFLDQDMNIDNSKTLGMIMKNVLAKEQAGQYQGKTINFQDLSNEMVSHIESYCDKYRPDILLIEIGGKINDLNISPLIIGVQNLINKHGSNQVGCILITFLSYFPDSNEVKTSAAQNSLQMLRGWGIEPNFIFLRANASEIKSSVITTFSAKTMYKASNIGVLPDVDVVAKVPSVILKQPIWNKIAEWSQIKLVPQLNSDWKKYLRGIEIAANSKSEIKIAIVLKNEPYKLCFLSVDETIKFVSAKLGIKITPYIFNVKKMSPDSIKELANYDGIIATGGHGEGFNMKVLIAKFAKDNKIPYLGLCFGLQAALVAVGKYELGIEFADSEEFYLKSGIGNTILSAKSDKLEFSCPEKNLKRTGLKHGQDLIRLANDNFLCTGIKDIKFNFSDNNVLASKLKAASGSSDFKEIHVHNFHFNEKFLSQFQNSSFVPIAFNQNSGNASLFAAIDHPFFVGTQGHPEQNSRPNKPGFLYLSFFKTIAEILKINIKN